MEAAAAPTWMASYGPLSLSPSQPVLHSRVTTPEGREGGEEGGREGGRRKDRDEGKKEKIKRGLSMHTTHEEGGREGAGQTNTDTPTHPPTFFQ